MRATQNVESNPQERASLFQNGQSKKSKTRGRSDVVEQRLTWMWCHDFSCLFITIHLFKNMFKSTQMNPNYKKKKKKIVKLFIQITGIVNKSLQDFEILQSQWLIQTQPVPENSARLCSFISNFSTNLTSRLSLPRVSPLIAAPPRQTLSHSSLNSCERGCKAIP